MLTEKKRIDSVAGRVNQSAKRPVEVVPVGNKSVKPSQRHLVRLQQWLKESLRENLRGPGLLRR